MRDRVPAHERSLYEGLCSEVETCDHCEGLPHAFVHPDFVAANAIPIEGDKLVLVDWTGAGRGPRLWSLAFLLWALGARSLRLVDVAAARYARRVTLEPEELARLPEAVAARPLMLECWGFWAGRRTLPEAVARAAEARALAQPIAGHARAALTQSAAV